MCILRIHTYIHIYNFFFGGGGVFHNIFVTYDVITHLDIYTYIQYIHANIYIYVCATVKSRYIGDKLIPPLMTESL